MAQLAVPGPLDEADLHDNLRTHPVRAQARQPLGLRERRLRNLERIQPRAKIQQQRVVEAGADLSGKARSPRLVEVADEQRAEPDALALRIGEAADDEAPASPRTSSSANASSGDARTSSRAAWR